MKLVVLGASGGCGRELARQAHARGHSVTAVVRPSSHVDLPAGIDIVRGDLGSRSFLEPVLRGHDAVLSALGLKLPGLAPWARPEDPDFLDRSTEVIVGAMRGAGVKRVVAISAGGVGDSRARVPGAFRAFIAATSLRKAYAALERMERAYLESGLDVCMCRPTGLTDEPATGKTVVVRRFSGRATIPRADVAAWMLDAVEKAAFTERTPMITVTGAA